MIRQYESSDECRGFLLIIIFLCIITFRRVNRSNFAIMHIYIFNARDIAAYMKWFSVPSYMEVSYMQHIFNIGAPVLATPLTRDFDVFKNEVYRELYYLWAHGFEDERSDVSAMSQDCMALVCDQECINLESYMKLITLHLIFTKNLPYVKVNFAGLPLALGITCEYSQFEENVYKAVRGFNLVSRDVFDRPFDLKLGVPDELLKLSLSDGFKQEILKGRDFRESLRREQTDKMNKLKEASLKEFGSMTPEDERRRKRKSDTAAGKKRSQGERANSRKTSTAQPKGIPLEERRHREGDKG